MLETIHTLIKKNSENISKASVFLHRLVKFYFSRSFWPLFDDILSMTLFEADEKELHSEFAFARIFEFDKLERTIEYIVERFRLKKDPKCLQVLQFMCVVKNNPLPLVQNYLYKLFYQDEREQKEWQKDVQDSILNIYLDESGFMIADKIGSNYKPLERCRGVNILFLHSLIALAIMCISQI